MTKEHIIVGLSGGVDSAVAALRLVEQGYSVAGLFMKNWEDDDDATACSAEADLADARQVCDELGIPLHQVNFAAEYRERVFSVCLRELRAGRTPNPDTLCNRHIKFGTFLRHARRLGADRVATGHYAAAVAGRNGRGLHRAADRAKDQSYFLYTLGQEQLSRACFPLADLHKTRVREIAADAGFDNFDKPDSTGICFIGERDFTAFMQRYIACEPGEIVSLDGEVVGAHGGIAFYTIGQRRGLGLGGLPDRDGRPWYVVDKDVASNRLIVAQGHDHPALFSVGLSAGALSWVDGRGPRAGQRLTVQVRYRQPPVPAAVRACAEHLEIVPDVPLRAVAPGQAVVVYDGERCLGGGIIEARIPFRADSGARIAIA